MSDLSPSSVVLFSDAAYSFDALPSIGGLDPATFLTDANGQPFPLKINNIAYDPLTGFFYDAGTGFRAVVYTNKDRSSIVIAFRGTVLEGPDAIHSLTADASLAADGTPKQFRDGLALFDEIVKQFPEANITLVGHSLGGAIAEFISSQNSLRPGDTIAAPGIAIPKDATRETVLNDTIDKSDPVGIYTGLLPGLQGHVGQEHFIGETTALTFLLGDFPVLGKIITIAAEIEHHKIRNYAKLMNVPTLEDLTNPHSLIDDPSSPLPALATFGNALGSSGTKVVSGTEIDANDGKLKIALQIAGDTASIIGKTKVGESVNATFVGGDGRDFVGGTTKDQIIAIGDRVIVFDGPNTEQETLVALGDRDVLVASGPSSTLFAFGNQDTLIANGDHGDVLVGNEGIIQHADDEPVIENLLQDRPTYQSLSEVLVGGSGNDTIYSSLQAFLGTAGDATLGLIPVNETIIGGTGNDTVFADLASGTDNVTILGGNGNDKYFYSVPIINNPTRQGIVKLFTGNGNDSIGGTGPAEIDLGKGNDFVLPGFGSIVNADGDPTRGQDVIFTANDVQLNNLQAQDRINLLGITDLTGGIQWKGLESPFAYGTFARYGINQNGELVIQTYLGRDGQTMFVSNYHGGPGVPISQETAGIFIAQASIGVKFLLDPTLPQGWLTGTLDLMKALLKASLGPDVLSKIGIDPLVFDLTGNGINLTDLSSVSPRFDMNGNGFSVQTGWVGQGNGLLVLDRDGDGQISNVSELFGGEATSGGPAAIGVAQLAKYDSNLDGVIDANDPIYSQLRIWVDANGNGAVDPGELLTLQQAGITSINLAPTPQSGDLNAGNQIMATGSFTRADGSAGTFADVSFQINTRDTTFTGDTGVSAAAAALPNLKGYGTLTDLRVAMTRDPALADSALGPSLMSVVQQTLPTLTSLDLPTLRADITPLLTAWANAVQGVDPNGNPLTIATQSHADVPILVATDGTGAETVTDFAYEVTDSLGSYWKLASGNTVKDSQGVTIQRPTLAQITSEPPSGSSWTTFSGAQLDFMERYTGESIPLGTGAPLNPGAALADAGQLISTMWQMLNQLAVAFAAQGPLAQYFQGIAYDASTNQFVPTTDQQLTPMYEAIFRAAPQDAAGATEWLQQWNQILRVVFGDFNRPQGLDVTYGYMFDSMVTAYETVGLPLDIRDAAAALGVPASEIVEGGSTLLSASDNGNIFYMSNGDQTAIGGNGVDNYVMGGHFGHDVIIDDEGILSGQAPNILRFAGIKSTDVVASRDGNDLVLDVKGTGQEVRVVNEFIGVKPSLLLGNINDAWGVTQIAFADGVVWEEPDMAWAVSPNTNGVNGTLLGTSAMDVLDGGRGNHFLSGGDGGDIYLYDRGDGNDTIFVNSDNPFQTAPNIIEFGPGIASSDLSFTRNGNSGDLLITVNGDPSDSLLIQGQFTATFTGVFGTQFFDRIQSLSFSDGTFKTFQDIENTLLANAEATPGMALYGFDGVDQTLDPGLGGNRFMSGGNNDDTYIFGLGYGNDTIQGGHTNILTGKNQTVLFNPGVDPSQVHVIRNGDSNDATLVLSDGSTLLLVNQFDAIFTGSFGVQYLDRIETFQFQDAARTVWTASDLMNKALAYEETNGGHTIFGFAAFDQTIDPGPGGNFFLSGGNNSDTYVFGLGYGNDTIKGGHNNILSSGNGNPSDIGSNLSSVTAVRDPSTGSLTLTLADGGTLVVQGQLVDGNDTLVSSDATAPSTGQVVSPFGSSDATLVLSDGGMVTFSAQAISGGGQTVLFGQGVDPSQVQVVRNGDSGDVTFVLSDGSALTVENQFVNAGAFNIWLDRIDNFQFQDAAGTRWSVDDVMNKAIAAQEAVPGGAIYGFQRGDTIDPGLGGNHFMSGEGGPDVYIFGQGYGNDTIFENGGILASNGTEVLFNADVDPSTVRLERVGASNDLEIFLADGSELDIEGQFDPTATFGPHFNNRIWTFQFQDAAVLLSKSQRAVRPQSYRCVHFQIPI
jgi:hypothetical protein